MSHIINYIIKSNNYLIQYIQDGKKIVILYNNYILTKVKKKKNHIYNICSRSFELIIF